MLSRPLPATNGNTLRTTVVEVAYGPGDSSLPHRHPCTVIGYVIDGAFRSQTEGASETIYRAGESFYEAPNSVHRVSANASATQPVRFTASFICDRDTPLSIELPHTDTTGARER
ncbi:MAG TPA: cupin domain-containing protein [Gemmatimonadales bacterium]|nr:cupin domain-containing protein [Gemmatimonadales bacterium]